MTQTMTAFQPSEPPEAEVVDETPWEETEAVDGVPVLDEAVPPVPAPEPAGRGLSPAAAPAVQTVAAAATGFVAGAATLAIARRCTARRLARAAVRRREALPIVGSRSFLIDIHLIGRD
jgi:hypothetical protein